MYVDPPFRNYISISNKEKMVDKYEFSVIAGNLLDKYVFNQTVTALI